jgi:hypothetical protein
MRYPYEIARELTTFAVRPYDIRAGTARRLDAEPADISYSVDALLSWRESVCLDVPVYAGVMVLASAGMARNLAAAIPDIDIPEQLVDNVARDRDAGVDAACEQVLAIRSSPDAACGQATATLMWMPCMRASRCSSVVFRAGRRRWAGRGGAEHDLDVVAGVGDVVVSSTMSAMRWA